MDKLPTHCHIIDLNTKYIYLLLNENFLNNSLVAYRELENQR